MAVTPTGRVTRARYTVGLAFLLAFSVAQAGTHDATSHQSFADVDHWAAVFDDPGRAAWQKPEEVVRALGLRAGMTAADLGAGTGYFSRFLSAAVGAEGTVFAVDTEPKMVERLRVRAERDRTANVVPVLASLDDARLPAGAVDVILLVDTYHHIDDRVSYFSRLRGALRPAGRVAVVDWQKREQPVGPPLGHRLAREVVVEEMRAAGYALAEEPDFLPYQYFLIFTRR
jgi:ubiquinone/menaquinone biosynthesis C-methylase UbiE